MADNDRVAPEPVSQTLAGLFGECDSDRLSEIRGDASTRRYFRYRAPNRTVVAALYPEPFDGDDFPFRQAADLLCSAGVRVPEILATDADRGVVVQEDIGELSLFRLASGDPDAVLPWLEQGVETAFRTLVEGTRRLPAGTFAASHRLDAARFEWELGYFRTHCLKGLWQGVETVELVDECRQLAAEAAADPVWLCHRDFQVRNLFVHRERLVVIDFQDAQLGPLHYDTASLLLDSIDLEPAVVERLLGKFRERLLSSDDREAVAAASVADDAWQRRFNAVAAQRLVKALGTYGFQITRRKRAAYRPLVASTCRRARRAVEELGDFRELAVALTRT